MKKETIWLNRLLNESWQYHDTPEGLEEFYKKNHKDLVDMDLEMGEEDNWEDIIEEKTDDLLDNNPVACLIVFLYEKGILTDEHIKEFFGGKPFGNSCYGDWTKKVEKLWKISLNEPLVDQPEDKG